MLRSYQGGARAREIISLGTKDLILNYYYVLGSNRTSEFMTEGYTDFIVAIAENFIRNFYKPETCKIELVWNITIWL
jgi:hypothetical protein